MAGEHCQEHSGTCERITGIQASASAAHARLDKHCNGGADGHVQRSEYKQLREDVSTLTTDVAKLHEDIQADRTQHAVDNARRDSITRLLIAGIGTAGIVAQYVFTHMLK